MIRVVYNPPAGHPPAEFVYAGRTNVLHPPDKFWKRKRETYVWKREVDPTADPSLPIADRSYPVTGVRDSWELDAEKNDALAKGLIDPPDNSQFMSDGTFKAAKKAKYRAWNQFVHKEQELVGKHKNLVDVLEKDYQEKRRKYEDRLKTSKTTLEALTKEKDREIAKAKEEIAIEARTKLKQELLDELRAELAAETSNSGVGALPKGLSGKVKP